MYFSRITLDLTRLTAEMMNKWEQIPDYAAHQWLWQLFPQQSDRQFLFHRQQGGSMIQFWMLSVVKPSGHHAFLRVETRPYAPQLETGMTLHYLLRANPVVCRGGKRSDVMMDAKYQAKARGETPQEWLTLQYQAAEAWLVAQSEKQGFRLTGHHHVRGIDRLSLKRRQGDRPILYSTANYAGVLQVTQPALFLNVLRQGLGKSKALGCGLLLIKRR